MSFMMEKINIEIKKKSSVYPDAFVVSTVPNLEHGYTVETCVFPPGSYGLGTEAFEMTYALNLNGDYIGNVDDAKYLCEEKGIRPILRTPDSKTCSIGKSVIDNKWYGWSHRALYGFEIGHTVVPGDCNYKPRTVEQYLDTLYVAYSEYSDLSIVLNKDKTEVTIKYSIIPENTDPSKNVDTIYCERTEPVVLGRGTWRAINEQDTIQMASEFAESVSNVQHLPNSEFTSVSDQYTPSSDYLEQENIPFRSLRADYITYADRKQHMSIRLSRNVYLDVGTEAFLESFGITQAQRDSQSLEVFGQFKAMTNPTSHYVAIRMHVVGITLNGRKYKLIKQDMVLTVPDYYPVCIVSGKLSTSSCIYTYVSDKDTVLASCNKNIVLTNGDSFVLEASGSNKTIRIRRLNTIGIEVDASAIAATLEDSYALDYLQIKDLL
jgi:hypothetical protein